MSKKRYFSVEKFIQDRKECGISEESINYHLEAWAKKCDGLEIIDDHMVSEVGATLISHKDWEIEKDE